MCDCTCKLTCCEKLHAPISLPHGKVVTVGRSHETNIKDPTLSRKQIKLIADVDDRTVKATPIGLNHSGVNGYLLKRNVEYTLYHKDRLELLANEYVYEIEFDPPPKEAEEKDDTHNKRKKRKVSADELESIKSKQPKVGNLWEEVDGKNLYIFTSDGVESKEKIASYDIDGTIIATKSGNRFAKDMNDWKLQFPEVKKKLRDFHNNDYKIVFFTNQAGVSSGKVKIDELKRKFEEIVKKLGVPVQIFIATTRTVYRKPAPGMWDILCNEKNDGIEIDLDNSFYIGDAAGRDNNWAPKKKKDHSIGDRLFALNIGLPFYTPEEHFLGARRVEHIMPAFDPRIDPSDEDVCEPKGCNLTSKDQEVIVIVGFPGSGKTFICQEYLIPKGYVHISRDVLGSWQKCYTTMEKCLKERKSVVVDNTNPDIESRRRYIDLARERNLPVRCFVMTTSIHQAKHNNLFRELTDKKHQQISEVIINTYKSKYVEPTKDEGFQEIIKINCIPKFKDPKLDRLYHMFLLEK